MYGLYKKRRLTSYEGETDTYETLLGYAKTPSELVNRWNAIQDAERNDIINKNKHKSYLDQVYPNIPDGATKITFEVRSGGGYASVIYEIFIKIIPQWDD